ncbi:MAG TPA: HdeD family acid-resistance protein [Propionibacteriaceae bacterium]|nr:HdeD family acid-resistance protein [Propionibacteriaceae bacterium]
MSATLPANSADGFPSLAKKIWIFAIVRGVLAIIFGLIALFAPIATAIVLAIVVGVYAIVNGVFDIIEAIRHRGSSSMVLRIVLGAISILFGILVLVWPGISLTILVILVGIWAIIIGILQIMASVRHRSVPNSGWVWGIVGGALSILFGILVLVWPGTGLVSIIWIIGIWAIVWGITLVVLGVQLRNAASTTEASASPTA